MHEKIKRQTCCTYFCKSWRRWYCDYQILFG